MATTVSLPSIHEMFPDHLIHHDRETPSSLRRSTRNPRPTVSAHSSHPPSHNHRDRERPLPYVYTTLRSSPTTVSLTYVASSASRVPSGQSVPPHNDSAAGPSSHRPYPRSSSSSKMQDQISSAYSHFSHPCGLPHISPIDVPPSSLHRTKPTSGRAIVYEYGEIIMDTTLDRRDGSLNPDDDGEGRMNGQLGTGQGKKHICPSCLKRFYRPSSLMIHVNTHTGATPFRCPWPNCGREFNVNSNMRRHYRNHTTPRGSGAARSAGAPQPTCIPPPTHSGMRHGERTPRATKSRPTSEDEEEFDGLDSDMEIDPPPRTSERRSAKCNAYPTPPNCYPSHSASPHLHPARSSPPPRHRGASRSPSYSPREQRHPYSYSPLLQPSVPHGPDVVNVHAAVRDKGYMDPPYAYHRKRDYNPQFSNGSPPSHPHCHSDHREYASDGDDKQMVHRRRPMMPGSSFHSSLPLPSVGGNDVREVTKYNPSQPYEDVVKDARVSTTLRRAVY